MNLFIPVILSTFLLSSIPAKIEYKSTEDLSLNKVIWSEEELINYVTEQAKENGVSTEKAIRVMQCETPWKRNEQGRYYDSTDAQSRLTYNEGQIKRNPSWGNVGDREKSYGVWQYHLPAHPEMSVYEASSVEISTEIAMQDLKVNPKKWTCYAK